MAGSGEAGRAVRVGYVGRLSPQKGVAWLVEAAARLSNADIELVLVGDGSERPRLERRVRELGLTGRVTFLGAVPHAEVPAVMAGLDLLVMPSVYEEQGSTLAEAMWCGLPIVATRVGGIPDVVRHLHTGFLVRPADAHSLATAIDQLAGEPELAASLAKQARAEAERYDWSRLAAAVLDIYRRAVGAD